MASSTNPAKQHNNISIGKWHCNSCDATRTSGNESQQQQENYVARPSVRLQALEVLRKHGVSALVRQLIKGLPAHILSDVFGLSCHTSVDNQYKDNGQHQLDDQRRDGCTRKFRMKGETSIRGQRKAPLPPGKKPPANMRSTKSRERCSFKWFQYRKRSAMMGGSARSGNTTAIRGTAAHCACTRTVTETGGEMQ